MTGVMAWEASMNMMTHDLLRLWEMKFKNVGIRADSGRTECRQYLSGSNSWPQGPFHSHSLVSVCI